MSGLLVTVLLSSHNGERYLSQALDSMIAQTYTNWEWVLVDNASTDGTAGIMESYRLRWPERVRMLRNREKLDLADSLNRGLEAVRGSYIARMDDDDVAHPDRLKLQAEALNRDPELVMVGTSAYCYHESTGMVGEFMPSLDSVQLRIALCWYNPFMHASVMFRRIDRKGNPVAYPTAYSFSEDYGLWAQLACSGRVGVLEQKLMTYRRRQGGMTGTGRERQLESTRLVSMWYTGELTRGTPLEGCQPEKIRDWVNEPMLPDALRLKRVKQIFDAAARSPFVSPREKSRAFMSWAESFLDRESWRHLLCVDVGRLLRACGRESLRYGLRRLGKPMLAC